MKIEQLYTSCLAQGAYYISSDGEAAIIDPLRESQQYVDKAEDDKVKIKYVFETHFHADFVSGHVDLARKTNSTIVFGPSAKTDYSCHIAKDQEEFTIGKIKIRAIHTPGHTPESTTYLLIDENGNNHAIFTGDTLFVGDVGRPDLAVANNITEDELARTLYDSLRNKIMTLEDNVLIYPAHGAGSACGKNMSSETFSTLGEQKKINYALRDNMTKAEFVKELLEGMPPPPSYFKQNALLNKNGYNNFDDVLAKSNKALTIDEFKDHMISKNSLVIDVRNQNEFIKKHIPNSLFVGLNGSFATWVGTIIKDIHRPIILIVEKGKEEEAITRLARVGCDNCFGYLDGGISTWEKSGNPTSDLEFISANNFVEMLKLNTINILDVRKESEFETQHIESSINSPLSQVHENLDLINTNEKLYVHCGSGYRSVIAISILKANGFDNLIDISGGYNAIKKTNLNENCYRSGLIISN
ncbi:MAG: MBL fold metallo-hydrolase [Flavobacteriaceae bacterium]|jgi:hydroxyacylglutathione hydrolase|nr:MBL fold metallo-hydrolase [Flavobacteriaceae bacterium]MBT4112973.1 MBL fold metallo-hydrolase [Flavobacteriaceae bacterium]MBT4245868.1 MBL fold metallo-hydrolase [Flavobacteriaceae bacterium]MBT4614594.1 MBL fold metallo-hydrolase [Flavobacteriaceae bacterium]MBT5246203.1 MBL fold metallo-hydrolase [Flavobacteriaceae bacterium]